MNYIMQTPTARRLKEEILELENNKTITAVRQWAGSFQVVPTRPVNPALYIK